VGNRKGKGKGKEGIRDYRENGGGGGMTELPDIFTELDEDIRELLSLVRLLKIDFRFSDVINDEAVNRIEKSISLAQRIQANLYSLKREVKL
jgi:hypothetical protein